MSLRNGPRGAITMKPMADIKEPFVYVRSSCCHTYVKVAELCRLSSHAEVQDIQRALRSPPTFAKLCHLCGTLMASHKYTSDRKQYNCSTGNMDTCDVSGLTVMMMMMMIIHILVFLICLCSQARKFNVGPGL